jgi:hypothetical protein
MPAGGSRCRWKHQGGPPNVVGVVGFLAAPQSLGQLRAFLCGEGANVSAASPFPECFEQQQHEHMVRCSNIISRAKTTASKKSRNPPLLPIAD